MTTYDTGRRCEDLACAYLIRKGYLVLARNYRSGHYEIDLVMRDGAATVFVEVKARASTSHGRPAEFVTAAKRRRLLLAAQAYLVKNGLYDQPARFDVIEVYLPAYRLVHIENAFGA